MKQILLIILFFVGIGLTQVHSTTNCGESSDNDFFRELLGDSAYSEVKDKHYILYTWGHHGYSWSAIVLDDNDYKVFSGKVTSGMNNSFSPQTEENFFDTIQLFSAYKSVIDWGFDSLSIYAKEMLPIHRTEYFPVSSTFKVVHPKSKLNSFSSTDIISYSGPDSIEFNTKLDKLEELMLWIAMPWIRTYTSDSIFCSKALLDKAKREQSVNRAGRYQENEISQNYDNAYVFCFDTIRQLAGISLKAFFVVGKRHVSLFREATNFPTGLI